ncbi:HTH DNA binding domain protein [Bacillus phage 010DV004]|nr:HTH DNA binding domain protein [Bacillus phage 010DV004]QZA69337.1 HTH DNA binding domain protein [Bacillus phage 010DV005]QZA69905.1 HTH DNA binding protein [Bacillus phage 043JT007]
MEKNKKMVPIRIVEDEVSEVETKGAVWLSKGQQEKIAAHYVAGRPVHEIEKMYNISRGTLYSILDREGVARRTGEAMTPSKLRLLTMSNEERSTIVKRYQDGERTTDLQKEYGITKHALYSLLDQAGVARRGKFRKGGVKVTTNSKSLTVSSPIVELPAMRIERDGDVLHVHIRQHDDNNPIKEVRVSFDKE